MADRYWVGGTGTWNDTSTTVWSTSSGGSSGASVPTSTDNVFFDQAGPYTVTTAVSERQCQNITVSGANYTFRLAQNVRIFGNVTLHSTTLWETSTPGTKANLLFGAVSNFTSTVTTNGVTVGQAVFNSAQVTLGSDFVGGTLSTMLTGSSFDSAGYSFTCGNWTPGASFDGIWNWQGSSITSTGTSITCTNTTFSMRATPQAFLNCTATTGASSSMTLGAGGSAIMQIPRINFIPNSANGFLNLSSNNLIYDFSCNRVGAKTIRFNQNTSFQSFNLRGSSGNVFTIQTGSSSQTPGTQRTLTKPGTWYVGANSTNVSGNANLTFTAGGNIDWLSFQDINGSALPTGNFLAFGFFS